MTVAMCALWLQMLQMILTPGPFGGGMHVRVTREDRNRALA